MPALNFSKLGFYDVNWNMKQKCGWILNLLQLHSPSKCLAWVKKCCHVWLDQNFDPLLLTNKLWLIFMGKKQNKFKMADSKKTHFSKSSILKIFLRKFSEIRAWDKGAFNNYVDQFWPNFDPLPPSSGQVWTFYIPPPTCLRGQNGQKKPPPHKIYD